MELEDFEHLSLIPALVKQIEELNERIKKFMPPITTKREVAKFLDVTPRTINNYIEQGYLKDGRHFYRKNGKILVFIEDAILEFRDKRNKGLVR
jgi:hypothetical protein